MQNADILATATGYTCMFTEFRKLTASTLLSIFLTKTPIACLCLIEHLWLGQQWFNRSQPSHLTSLQLYVETLTDHVTKGLSTTVFGLFMLRLIWESIDPISVNHCAFLPYQDSIPNRHHQFHEAVLMKIVEVRMISVLILFQFEDNYFEQSEGAAFHQWVAIYRRVGRLSI